MFFIIQGIKSLKTFFVLVGDGTLRPAGTAVHDIPKLAPFQDVAPVGSDNALKPALIRMRQGHVDGQKNGLLLLRVTIGETGAVRIKPGFLIAIHLRVVDE